jgi:hypothetical protein
MGNIGVLGEMSQPLKTLKVDKVDLLKLRIDSPRPHPTMLGITGRIE